ncbi:MULTISPECIES: tripartite tricarboxylate transporter substrate binding protein [Diaphorobacter]|uniref:tripartite tricarboxylate transporter substrate binding protein n=1 Tax=Diaphorobacter TaxID=238749 RepID=UPI000B5A0DF7|nr:MULTISPECIES: tripartite tricarboxylate transporter substrate binding protein [Diaphorobacter]ASI69786.1 ABC transporter substrate-binding protein [Diaphorobacter nitroreducens]UOB05450.1 tripartite tricarboxylate transporter substrate binding protein [Diaphorobacter sp. LI3]
MTAKHWQPTRRATLALCLAASWLAAAPAHAQADNWPAKPIRIVVGFPAGSFTDTIARAVSDQLSKQLGQPVIVDNKPGANGAIGVGEVARSAPDGYTLLVTNSSSITINPQIYKKITYQPKDFAPVTMLLDAPFILTANPDWASKHQIRSAQDVIAYAKRNPDKISYGSAGPGNIAHLAFAQWSNRTGVKTTHVPYKSASQAQLAVLSGELDTQFDTWSALPQIAASKLLPLAVTAPQRMKQLPNVPTMAEAGYADFNVTFWAGLFAPAGTPPAIVDKLYEATKSMLQNEHARNVLSKQGDMVMLAPEPFGQRIAKEVADWKQVIQREAIALD